jgi:hypothetical protein
MGDDGGEHAWRLTIKSFWLHESNTATESQSKTLVLGLHQQRHKYKDSGSTYVAMDIRSLSSISSKDDAGYIELHYVELHAFQSDTVVDCKDCE